MCNVVMLMMKLCMTIMMLVALEFCMMIVVVLRNTGAQSSYLYFSIYLLVVVFFALMYNFGSLKPQSKFACTCLPFASRVGNIN